MCEQWTSPLACDSDHPQDIALDPNSYSAELLRLGAQAQAAKASADGFAGGGFPAPPLGGYVPPPDPLGPGRRLAEATWDELVAASTTAHALASVDRYAPAGVAGSGGGGTDADEDLTLRGASPVGPAGTYNHLIDALLDVPLTRSLYLRRLRTLSDRWLAGGRLRDAVVNLYGRIRTDALQDDAVWKGGSIDVGVQQLLTEWIPLRTAQLGVEYAPGGATPLLPKSASGAPYGSVKVDAAGKDGDAGGAPWVALRSSLPDAVDLQGWTLSAESADVGATTVVWRAPPGSVLPAADVAAPGASDTQRGELVIAESLAAVRGRSASPRGDEGRLVAGGLERVDDFNGGGGSVLVLRDGSGNEVGREGEASSPESESG